MEFKKLLPVALAAALLAGSCATPKNTSWLMDLEYQTQYDAPPAPDLTIQPGDVLNIQVYSENTTLAAPFNSLTGDAGQTSGKSLSYIVDTEGDIDFPVLGLLRVAGKTTKEIKEEIAAQICAQGYIKDPVVKVALGNFHITFIGRTGNKVMDINGSSINIIDALARNGGIEDNANLKDIMVIRTANGQRQAYSVNIRSKEIYDSPAFWLQQNDVVYVKPKGARLNSNGQMVMTFVGTGLTLASIITNVLLWRGRVSK